MKDFRTKAVMLGVLCVCLAPVSQADEQTKETHMSINGPLQVRDILLPPGQYVFRLTEPDLDHSVVSIYNAQTNRLEGTIIGAPAYRLAADDKHLFTISQPRPVSLPSCRPGFTPATISAWSFRGSRRPWKQSTQSNPTGKRQTRARPVIVRRHAEESEGAKRRNRRCRGQSFSL
jgi:hypothetical protein